ncbi:PTS system, mannose/fructose/sorbose family, IIA component [hydrothermal vent metagenome]|uniref:PTS system, mannose/fructose/sorbose family, IIA component n=1 Tax=hydrothermal vent metagenome TaxID=652676 RepID=A0A3B1BL79_9ZZZZ
MSIGLLLVTHNNMGTELLATATTMLGNCPLQTNTLTVPFDCDLEQAHTSARHHIQQLDQGDGVLVLTDIFGSTPSNIVCAMQGGERVIIVTGLNLPMLIRVLNYPKLDLPTLAEKAESGGHTGIIACQPDCN